MNKKVIKQHSRFSIFPIYCLSKQDNHNSSKGKNKLKITQAVSNYLLLISVDQIEAKIDSLNIIQNISKNIYESQYLPMATTPQKFKILTLTKCNKNIHYNPSNNLKKLQKI